MRDNPIGPGSGVTEILLSAEACPAGGRLAPGEMMPVAPAREQIALQAQLLDEVDAAVMLLDFSAQHAVVCYWSRAHSAFTAIRPKRRWAAC